MTNAEHQQGGEGTTWTSQEWAQRVAELVRRRAATFLNEPGEMLASYERERLNIEDYRGRELLELLQNADDAGAGYGPNKALIQYQPEGLCVANTGIPFIAAGVESLMISNLSPKKLDRSRYIGNRGLGFRSILTWTDCPFILSGNLRLAFSPSLAASRLDELLVRDDTLCRRVKEWQGGGHQPPIPILACPVVVDENGLAAGIRPCQNYDALWQYASNLRKTYDTVIAIPFTEPGAAEEVLAQVEAINEELMLFLQYLGELTANNGQRSRTWRAERNQDDITIRVAAEEDAAAQWRVSTSKDLIPEELLGHSQRSTRAYEIKIAVRNDGLDPGVLFNYFPTKVRFPYPVVAHITMELTSNRQNLVASKANRFLAQCLAKQLADVAEQSMTGDDPWQPLRLVADTEQGHDPVLEELGFQDALLAALRDKRIIPRRSGLPATVTETKRIPVDPESWLPLQEFDDLILWTDDQHLRRLLDRLRIKELSAAEFRERAERLPPRLDPNGLAALLAGIIRNRTCRFLPKTPPAKLLLDANDVPVDPNVIAYFPPTSEWLFQAPHWMELRFVSRPLVEALLAALGFPRERLAEELRAAGYEQVHSYDFGGVAAAIVSQTNRRCLQEPSNELAIRREGIQALGSLYRSVADEQRPSRDAGLKVALPTRSGDWMNADTLYLGDPYCAGQLMDELLGKIHPELFVADPQTFAGASDEGSWDDFLQWLGAATRPRPDSASLSEWQDGHKDYLQHMRSVAKYPMEFDEFTVSGPNQLDLYRVDVTSIQHIDEILTKADPYAIVAWVALDERLAGWLRDGDLNAKLHARFKERTYRTLQSHRVASYVVWLLRETAWLPVTDGGKERPTRCVLHRTTGQELQRIFPQPAIDPKAQLLQKFDINQETLTKALVSVGVRISLSDLSWPQCYKLMLELPTTDPDGKAATKIYRLIAGKEEEDDPALLPCREEFEESGKLWCCLDNNWDYVPVRDGIYFANDATIPRPVVAAFPIIDVPRGSGAEKIARIFNVKVLRQQDISIEVVNCSESPNGIVLNDQFVRLKPYVLALRFDETPDVEGIGRFRKLTIVSCSEVEARARVSGVDLSLRLTGAGESLISGDKAYLIVDREAAAQGLENPLVGRHISNIVAAVLQVKRTSDFALLARDTDHETRKRLLSDILQHDCTEVLQRAFDELQASSEDMGTGWPVNADLIQQAAKEQQHEAAVKEKPREGEAEPTDRPKPSLPGAVVATGVPHEPTAPRRRIAQRVHTQRSPGGSRPQGRQVTDGNRCEELGALFEESQGRFPWRVGPLQGTEGFGCDVLSFATADDRQRCIDGLGVDISCVERFIEVKGRSLAKGAIPLEGNELEAARKRREKFYLYRIYEAVDGQGWDVVELANPLAYDWDLTYTVDPFRCPETKKWTVKAVEGGSNDIAQG